MTRQQAIEFILASNGRIVGVEFIKRSDGTIRRMQCRLGVTSHLKGDLGSGPAYNAREHGLLTVFDMAPGKGYRSIPTEGITQVSVNGTWTAVQDSPDNPA